MIHSAHVEGDVHEVEVQEHDRDHAPVLVGDEHVGGRERAHALQRRGAAGAEQGRAPGTGGELNEEDDDVDGDQHLGHRPAGAGPDEAAALPAAAGLLPGHDGGAPRAAPLLGHAVRAAKADRRRDHALVADRASAVRAAHAGLALGVTVAVFDVQIVGQVQLEVLARWIVLMTAAATCVPARRGRQSRTRCVPASADATARAAPLAA